MYQQPLQQQRWPVKKGRPQSNGRMKEQRHEDYEGQENGDGDEKQPSLDQYAGGVARNLIKQTRLEDTTQNWRAIKRAYLAGYADASR
jgi:hypothetical protein